MSELTGIALSVAEKRYLQRDDDGNLIENWSDLCWRVVNHVCKNESEKFKEKVFQLLFNTFFLPNSPCLVNAGKKNKIQGIMACFVTAPPEDCWSGGDEMVGMVENIANFGHIARKGGGAGVSFSKIRPEGDPVFGSTHAKACGPIEHMRMISEVMASITQAGFRSMAMMSTLMINHPDIKKFIVCKQRERALKSLLKEDIFNHYEQLSGKTDEQLNIVLDKFIHNFNISVVATDDFMKKVEKDEEYDLVFNGKVYDTVKAKDIFKMIVENAWKNGDPGLIFYDTANNGPYKYSKQEITATNPCGEQQLPSWGSCNLGSIDVSKFYDDKKKDVNWAELKEAIGICIQFLDNVIDANAFPTWRFESWALDNRPVGLGIMGLADLLLKLGLAYGSEESLKFADKLASFFEKEAHKKSVELGKSRGTPKNCRFDELEHRRNITTISIAPTGSISMLASCSSSIEPIYSPETYRYDNTGASLVVHPDADKKHFRCAVDKTGKFTEVSWEEHVKMQAVFQKHCDSGVSKTVNLRNSATLEEVYNAYMLAWKRKCKGITVYRDGSKTTQVLNTSKKTKIGFNNALPRPDELPCNIHNVTADGFEWHIMIGLLDDTPYEVFAVNGKTSLPPQGVIKKKKKRHYSLLDNDGNVLIDNIALAENKINPKIDLETRRFSMELRHGIHPKFIVKQIDKANCVITSFEKAIGRIFKTKYIDAFELLNEPCPSCLEAGRGNGKLSYQSGCKICEICQYSACG